MPLGAKAWDGAGCPAGPQRGFEAVSGGEGIGGRREPVPSHRAPWSAGPERQLTGREMLCFLMLCGFWNSVAACRPLSLAAAPKHGP